MNGTANPNIYGERMELLTASALVTVVAKSWVSRREISGFKAMYYSVLAMLVTSLVQVIFTENRIICLLSCNYGLSRTTCF